MRALSSPPGETDSLSNAITDVLGGSSTDVLPRFGKEIAFHLVTRPELFERFATMLHMDAANSHPSPAPGSKHRDTTSLARRDGRRRAGQAVREQLLGAASGPLARRLTSVK